jgi:hypothetical protein
LTCFLLDTAPPPHALEQGCRIVANWAEFSAMYATALDPSAHTS